MCHDGAASGTRLEAARGTVTLGHNWSGHLCCHDVPNLRRHPVILVRGHEIELEVPDVRAIHHAELSGWEGIRICTVMRSILPKTFSAQVHDHAELHHLISAAEVDRHALAQLRAGSALLATPRRPGRAHKETCSFEQIVGRIKEGLPPAGDEGQPKVRGNSKSNYGQSCAIPAVGGTRPLVLNRKDASATYITRLLPTTAEGVSYVAAPPRKSGALFRRGI